MIYPIVVYGSPVLKKVAEEIDENYEGLNELIDSMFETMYSADGVGLAAPQIGKSIRLFVMDASPFGDEYPELKGFKKAFINAEIIERDGDTELMNEGCLSVPEIREDVERPGRIKMTYYDQDWKFHEVEYDGWIARIIQHEYDHLDGILFTDRLSALRRKMISGRLKNLTKGKFDVSYRTKLLK